MIMKIETITVRYLAAPLSTTYWMSLEPYRVTDELLVQIVTDDGLAGTGVAHGRPMADIIRIIQDAFTPVLVGQNPLDHERLWQAMFTMTHSRQEGVFAPEGAPHFGSGLRAQVMAAIAGIDIALWDLKGKILGQPVYRLLGGLRNQVPAYASGGYYTDDGIAGLVSEVESYVSLGYTAVKMKVGGETIAGDLERVRAVRTAVGDDVDIMLDANSAYDVDSAIAAARAFSECNIRWFEEPLHWYDAVHGLGQVAQAIDIPIASGESEIQRWACRDLVLHGGIRIMQYDATRAGGVTDWLKVAAHAGAHAVTMAPHHDPQIHGHLVATASNGLIVETFPNAQRDPLWAELYSERPEISNGILTLTDKPGFGVEFDERALDKYTAEVR